MKSRHESHHRHCLLSPFTCFQFLLLFSFFFVIFSSTHSSVKFHPSLWSIAGHTAHEKKSSDATCDLIYIQTSPYSLLSRLKPPSHEKMRGKHNPHRCVTIIVVIFLFCSVHRPIRFLFLAISRSPRIFAAKCEKKSLKKFRPNRVKLTRKPSEGGGGNKGKKIDAEICALRNKKKRCMCLFINSNSLRAKPSPHSSLASRVSSETRKKCSSQMKKKWDEKYFFYCCGLFQAHQQRLLLPRLCRKKNLCTMDTHRFVCANFSHLFRREKREMKFAEKSKKMCCCTGRALAWFWRSKHGIVVT